MLGLKFVIPRKKCYTTLTIIWGELFVINLKRKQISKQESERR